MIDTNVLSELMRSEPSSAVLRWLDGPLHDQPHGGGDPSRDRAAARAPPSDRRGAGDVRRGLREPRPSLRLRRCARVRGHRGGAPARGPPDRDCGRADRGRDLRRRRSARHPQRRRPRRVRHRRDRSLGEERVAENVARSAGRPQPPLRALPMASRASASVRTGGRSACSASSSRRTRSVCAVSSRYERASIVRSGS